jgi:hypothetical protein
MTLPAMNRARRTTTRATTRQPHPASDSCTLTSAPPRGRWPGRSSPAPRGRSPRIRPGPDGSRAPAGGAAGADPCSACPLGRREELAEQGGPAGEGVAALADARLDGQAQEAGLVDGLADVGRPGGRRRCAGRDAGPGGPAPRPSAYCGGGSGMVSARCWRQKSASVGGRLPVTSATRSCGRMLGVPGWPRNAKTHPAASTPPWPPSWPTTGPPPWPGSPATASICSGPTPNVMTPPRTVRLAQVFRETGKWPMRRVPLAQSGVFGSCLAPANIESG